jgi:hypothetical protein
LSAINATDDELYALADEVVDNENYLKMRSTLPVQDYTFSA